MIARQSRAIKGVGSYSHSRDEVDSDSEIVSLLGDGGKLMAGFQVAFPPRQQLALSPKRGKGRVYCLVPEVLSKGKCRRNLCNFKTHRYGRLASGVAPHIKMTVSISSWWKGGKISCCSRPSRSPPNTSYNKKKTVEEVWY